MSESFFGNLIKPVVKAGVVAAGTTILFLAPPAMAGEIPINPVTPDIRDKVHESYQLVADVDKNVGPKIREMEKLWNSSEPCRESGKEYDAGCVEIKRQIREKYIAILDGLEKSFPKIEGSLSQTSERLGRSIHNKTAGKTLEQVYQSTSGGPPVSQPQGMLSKKLYGMLKALSIDSDQSLLEVGLRYQSDLIDANEMLGILKAKVGQQLARAKLDMAMPEISDEMAIVLQGVSDFLGYDSQFGSAEDEYLITTDHYDSWDS
ncbi:hypothetical protein Dalk_2116 [Desulfatibacillum aliphaticivorans]|uniref:Uncharacterized protein n=1 Tax=Desulfatibacillum aliphaticivorans TaxID=218208 RepID=B8FGD0_DESAL|nr:hypothetical protein [Desulfatibacillum aliphaticivorans]ACL03810.1 hypothetical protein Dalk_2116 [Desulfatibacillum aliphaticivorans]